MEAFDGDIRYLVGSPVGDYPIFIRCPFHDDRGRPNYAVYADGAYCFNCGASESPRAFALRLGSTPEALQSLPRRDLARRDRSGSAHRGVPNLPSAEDLLQRRLSCAFYHRVLTQVLPERQAWLLNRAILPETIRTYQLGHNGNYFVIPVWEGSRLHGFKWRSDPAFRGDRRPKYRNDGVGTVIFRPNPSGRKCVIVEGELDALVVAQYGYDAVTTTSGAQALRKIVNQIRTRKDVLIAVDQDDPGEQVASQLMEYFPHARRVRFHGKDITEALASEPRLARRRVLRSILEGG